MAHKSSITLLACFAAAFLLLAASPAHAMECFPESMCCPGTKPCPDGSACDICTLSIPAYCVCSSNDAISQLHKLEQQQQQQLSLLPASSPALQMLLSSSSSSKLKGPACAPHSPCCPGIKECEDESMQCLICLKIFPPVCLCTPKSQASSLPAEEPMVLLPASSPALQTLSSSSSISSSGSSSKLKGPVCAPNSQCCPGIKECEDESMQCLICTKSLPPICICTPKLASLPAEELMVLLPSSTDKEDVQKVTTEEEDAKLPLLAA